MLPSFQTRLDQPELMDDFSLDSEELRHTLVQLGWVNRWLGGYGPVQKGVAELAQGQPNNQPLKVLDLGCGGGDTLRGLASWARKKDLKIEATGLDANPSIVTYAREQSRDWPELSFRQGDCFKTADLSGDWDIILCSLFLHHFNPQQLRQLLPQLHAQARLGLVINDLQRHWLAYRLFALVTRVLPFTAMARQDGLLSIRKAFTRSELTALARHLAITHPNIRWQWAFRYLWVVNRG
jgi:2-polyprenyl-3-methyl-5-hydroxy-6-metoxy-1,4-benzoquinol methylase